MNESVLYQEIIRESIIQGMAEGLMQGAAEGMGKAKLIAEVKRKVALNLVKTGMNLEEISEITELPLAEIQALENPTTVN